MKKRNSFYLVLCLLFGYLPIILVQRTAEAQTVKHKIANYCETGYFDLSLHNNEFESITSIPCYEGSTFNNSIDNILTNVNVIFVGGDASFSQSTADKIEQSVYDDGKILVLNFWSDDLFEKSLPVSKAGFASYGSAIEKGDTTNSIVKQIAAGLPNLANRNSTDYNRRRTTIKNNATAIYSYSNDKSPVMAVWSYGKGKVIYYSLELIGAFISNKDADRLCYQALQWALSSQSLDETKKGWRHPRNTIAGHNYYASPSIVQSTGAFVEKWSSTTLAQYERMLTSDVNGDGKLEIVASKGKTITILSSTGQVQKSFDVNAASCSVDMLEDVSGDGIDDIGIGCAVQNGVLKVYFYNASGVLLKTLSKNGGYDSSMGPVTRLGNGDIIVNQAAGYSTDPRGYSRFNYTSGAELWYYDVGPAHATTSIADMDGDGKMELANMATTVHNGASGDGFNHNGAMTTDSDFFTIIVDEDGKQELTMSYLNSGGGESNNGGAFHFFVNLDKNSTTEILAFEEHDPTYYPGASQVHLINPVTKAIVKTFTSPTANTGWLRWNNHSGFAIADVNNDGKDEVIVSNNGVKLYVLDFNLSVLKSASINGWVEFCNDLDGDGALEIVISDGSKIKVLDGNLTEKWNFTCTSEINRVLVSDLDNNGKNELEVLTKDKLQILESIEDNQSIDLTRGLVAYYPFNGNANDESGNNNHGVIYGATLASDRFSTINRCFMFDGVDDYIKVNNSPSINFSNDFTISFWTKPDTWGLSRGIISKKLDDYSSGYVIYCDGYYPEKMNLRFMGTGGDEGFVLSNSNVALTQWTHWAVIYDNGTAYWFKNGILDIKYSELTKAEDMSNMEPLHIGHAHTWDWHGYATYFDGLIDDVRLYNRALNTAEISALYASDGSTARIWNFNIEVRDNCSGSVALTFGLAASATNGLDAGLGETEAPPAPPSGVFDARFELPVTPAVASTTDYRSDQNTSAAWTLKFQPGSCGYPIILSWSNTTLPEGSFYLKDNITGTLVNVDMKAQSSYTLSNTGITSLKIEYSKQQTKTINLASGWNMISVPLAAVNMTKSTLFPTAASSAFAFSNGYVTAATLENAKGYWLKYNTAEAVAIQGSSVANRTIPVKAGWNMIGAFENDAAVSAITSTPAGIISSSFFGFDNGYKNATTLASGKGYWIKVTQDGVLNLSSSLLAKTTPIEQSPHQSEIIITDNAGFVAHLAVINNNHDLTAYDLPPLPPAGLPDIRFASDRWGASFTDTNFNVKLNGLVFPIQVAAKEIDLLVKDGPSGAFINFLGSNTGSITINSAVSSLMFELSDINSRPLDYALDQNYPNPFNPVTMIQYALSADEKVELAVFNVRGEKIKDLVSGNRQKGVHQVEFRAEDLASGLYYYRLKAGSFIQTKKMVIMK